MKYIILIIFVIILVLLIVTDLEIDLDDTVWIEKSTDKIVFIVTVADDIVIYKYPDDTFNKSVDILTFFRNYKYVGK